MNARALDLAVVEQADVAPFVPGNGLVLRLAYGPFVRPVSRPRWVGDWRHPWRFDWPNPWSQWRWFTIRLPFVVLPFVSFRLWRRDRTYDGFYLGGKVITVGDSPGATWPHPGHTYARPEEAGRRFVTLSGSFRWRHRE